PNRANMVYYLRGGMDALRRECPWMFDVPRIKVPETLAGCLGVDSEMSVASSCLTTSVDETEGVVDGEDAAAVGEREEREEAFVGWGDEPVEYLPAVGAGDRVDWGVSSMRDEEEKAATEGLAMRQDSRGSLCSGSSATTNGSEDVGVGLDEVTVAAAGDVEESEQMDCDEEEEEESVVVENMVDSGIGRFDDASSNQVGSNHNNPPPRKKKALSSSTQSTPIAPSPTRHHHHHHHHHHHSTKPFPHIIQSVAKHPQTHFPHLAKTNSPTHDLRNLQHHLVAAVWYGKRVPAGDVAVPIAHVSSCSSSTSTDGRRNGGVGGCQKVTSFLHLSSCYAAADARELKEKGIRHVVRLGWGFDAFSNGYAFGSQGGEGDSEMGGSGHEDDGVWSEWEDSHDGVPGGE
ncbi:hypothetical protein HDU98_005833, partial [Podochytrium sp. JEL0797]